MAGVAPQFLKRYQLTPEAGADIFVIWSFIADDNPDAADRLHAACKLLASNPKIGQVREELTNRPVRFWPVEQYPNYVIVYAPDTKPLRVIRVLHAARDLRRLL